jgi:hypothetical protein
MTPTPQPSGDRLKIIFYAPDQPQHESVSPGLGPNNENTMKNSLISCQIFRLLKLLSNISVCVHMKQF